MIISYTPSDTVGCNIDLSLKMSTLCVKKSSIKLNIYFKFNTRRGKTIKLFNLDLQFVQKLFYLYFMCGVQNCKIVDEKAVSIAAS